MDLLNIGKSGLNAYQRALATTGQNIANVSTPSYSRQRVSFQSQSQQNFVQGGYASNGVNVTGVSRTANDLLNQQLNESIAKLHQQSAIYDKISQIDSLLSNSKNSVDSGLNDFFNATHTANADPANISTRTVLLNQSNVLVNRFNEFSDQVHQQALSIDAGIKSFVGQINKLSTNIATLNQQISSSSGNPSPDLLDQRDKALKDLSSLIGFNALEQSDGSVNVFIAGGTSLVVGGTTQSLTTIANRSDPSELDVAVVSGNTALPLDSTQFSGGSLSGYLNLRSQVIDPLVRSLDRLALGIQSAVNTQNKLGIDLNGNLGSNFFNDINDPTPILERSISNSNNTGNGALAVNIVDVGDLTDDEYRVTYDGTNYQITNVTQGTVTAAAALPQTIDGFTVSLNSGVPLSGDTFSIIPTRYAARDLSVNLGAPSAIALAVPIRAASSSLNGGTGKITDGVVTDTTNAAFSTTAGQLSPPVSIEFLSATTYRILNKTTGAVLDAGPLNYNPAISNVIFPSPAYDPGYTVSISGVPVTGDVFEVDYNTNGRNDNRNGLLLAGIQNQSIFDSGTTTSSGLYGAMVANVGNVTHQSDLLQQSLQSLSRQIQDQRDSVSAVNLDEEAANLLTYQQAYQANAKLISIAQDIFTALFAAIR